MGKFVYGKESGTVYIDRHRSNILNNALEGAVFPSVLKGFLWGQCLGKFVYGKVCIRERIRTSIYRQTPLQHS